ncbi:MULTISPECIES: hypothetical protein [unclassified Nocardioides]|uniref:hypothetical protein n=1 Tax=unclassified Nocardioides TaxID=2615069 RepID=UPI00071295D0|nr:MULTISPECIES: hypothetical protein [unclassified Nocardioides]KRA37880.1 hypothetical protein ASD81_04135 [Nocardioides sp. Root614]KRA91840.1 hypothetical protein ASD84_04400 [Nocardioides sp. Root682]
MKDTQQAPHTAQWLASADAAALEAEGDRASAGLRALSRDGIESGLASVVNVLRRTLENGSELDPLPPSKARPLVMASLVFIRDNREAILDLDNSGVLVSTLRRLHHRKEQFGNPTIIRNLDDLMALLGPEEPTALAAAPSSGNVPALTPSGESSPQQSPLDEWLIQREGFATDDRIGGDIRFLNAYLGRAIPTSFAEALYHDDSFWSEAPVLAWLDLRAEPFDADTTGVAAAALLNAKLRLVRPRFFLRNPSSLVIQPIANSAELEQLRTEIRNDLVVRTLTTVLDARSVLESERRRGPKATVRKNEVLKVSDTLKALFSRLGFDERPEVGTSLAFDPVEHHGPSDTESQESVVVTRPGLWDLSTNRYIISPVVRRPRDQRVEDESGESK